LEHTFSFAAPTACYLGTHHDNTHILRTELTVESSGTSSAAATTDERIELGEDPPLTNFRNEQCRHILAVPPPSGVTLAEYSKHMYERVMKRPHLAFLKRQEQHKLDLQRTSSSSGKRPTLQLVFRPNVGDGFAPGCSVFLICDAHASAITTRRRVLTNALCAERPDADIVALMNEARRIVAAETKATFDERTAARASQRARLRMSSSDSDSSNPS
jgi:hypothetical protein